MSRQRVQHDRPPYTKVLSALLKTDLLRLSTEFRLSSEGSVVTLRKRLKDYMNLHRNTLSRNPRFVALFPRHARPPQPQPPPFPNGPRVRSPSALSYVGDSPRNSPTFSDDSWHGIGVPPQPHNQSPAPHNPPAHLAHEFPTPSPPSSDHGSPGPSPPPTLHDDDGREFPSLSSLS